jgi:hypothetical protein
MDIVMDTIKYISSFGCLYIQYFWSSRSILLVGKREEGRGKGNEPSML